jgi:LysR family transcriptional regulator, nitrogen assimilation regulatory protein
MELKQLEYYKAIVDAGSFSRAADQIDIAQPALSRCVAQLEQTFGVPLLHRHGRGVRTTEAGLLLYEQACALLHQASRTANLMRDHGNTVQGHITVGMPTSVAQNFAPPLVKAVLLQLPNVRLTVREALSWHLEEQVLSGALDMAVLYDNDPSSPLALFPLSRQPLFLVGPAAESKSRAIKLAALAQLPMVIPSRPHAIRRAVDRALASIGFDLKVVAEIDGTSTILELVAQGLGYAVLTEPTVRLAPRPQRFLLQAISKPAISTQLVLAYAKARPISRAQGAVHEIFKRIVQPMASF